MPYKDKNYYHSEEYKEHQRIYQREWHQRHREKRLALMYERKDSINKYIQEVKSQMCCVDCGQQHPATLHFHHLNPEDKKFNISGAGYYGISLKKVKAEIEKCIVLCANCHAIRHYNERTEEQADHGIIDVFELCNPLQVVSSEHECFGNHSYQKREFPT